MIGQIDSLPGCYDDEVAMGKQLEEVAMGWLGQRLRSAREAWTAARRFRTGIMEDSWSVGGLQKLKKETHKVVQELCQW